MRVTHCVTWLWELMVKEPPKFIDTTFMPKKKKTPELSLTQANCLRFILEENPGELKTDYKLGSKTYRGVEWEYCPNDHRVLVRIDEYNHSELIIPFMLENFPVIREHINILVANGEI